MHLLELLAEDRILIGVKGETVREAARELMHAVIASGHAVDSERLDALLDESLPSEAVTLRQRAFLLHFRSDAVDRLTVVIGVTAGAVHREHDPGKEARVVLLVVAPPRETPAYLRTVGTLARLLGGEEIVEALEAAEAPADILTLDALADIDVADEVLVRHVSAAQRASTGPETTVGDAERLMTRNRISALPIVSDDGAVLGMVTYAELLRHLLPSHVKRTSGEQGGDEADEPEEDPLTVAVREIMDRSVLCISDDQPLADVARVMIDKKLDRVPVVREGVLVGMLTRERIVRRLFGP